MTSGLVAKPPGLKKRETCLIIVNVMISVWKWRERMSNLLPSLPPAGSDTWELHLAAFGKVERCGGASVTQQPALLGFPAGEPFKKTNKCLQHRFPLERYLTKWAVSFHV